MMPTRLEPAALTLESSTLPLSHCAPDVMRLPTGLDKQKFMPKIVNIFLPISFNLCFGCSKEPSHSDGYFEYLQHIFWLRNKKVKFLLYTLTERLLMGR